MTGHTPKDPDFRARVHASFARQTLMHSIGARIALLEPGRCVIEMEKRADLCQQHGFLHAGITTTLADTAAGYAALSLMPPKAEVLTTEFKINLINPAQGPVFVATADVLKPGRTLSVVRADVHARGDSGDVLVASMLATMICLPG